MWRTILVLLSAMPILSTAILADTMDDARREIARITHEIWVGPTEAIEIENLARQVYRQLEANPALRHDQKFQRASSVHQLIAIKPETSELSIHLPLAIGDLSEETTVSSAQRLRLARLAVATIPFAAANDSNMGIVALLTVLQSEDNLENRKIIMDLIGERPIPANDLALIQAAMFETTPKKLQGKSIMDFFHKAKRACQALLRIR